MLSICVYEEGNYIEYTTLVHIFGEKNEMLKMLC